MSATTSSSANAPPPPNKPSSPTANVKPSRLPAPTLFVGPPSRNASHLSISRQQTHESRSTQDAGTGTGTGTVKKASERSLEAKWKEMQSTLNEVEFTARSSTHVFGEAHSRALEDLKRAQVELARAWGVGRDATEEKGEDGGGGGGGEDETAEDIRLASERRAANEAYFKKVEGGVRDVVQKLEVVAEAMRGVEGESRSLWSSDGGMSVESGNEVVAGREEGVKR